MHASKLRYQGAYQGFGNDATVNTLSSNFCLAQRSCENGARSRMNHLMSSFISLYTHYASSYLHLLVHFVFIVAILLLSTNPGKLYIYPNNGYFFLSLGTQSDYRSLWIVSEKDSLTGLEVTIPSSSRIFQGTGLTFSPRKCIKFIVCILA